MLALIEESEQVASAYREIREGVVRLAEDLMRDPPAEMEGESQLLVALSQIVAFVKSNQKPETTRMQIERYHFAKFARRNQRERERQQNRRGEKKPVPTSQLLPEETRRLLKNTRTAKQPLRPISPVPAAPIITMGDSPSETEALEDWLGELSEGTAKPSDASETASLTEPPKQPH